ncbi:MAG TPA: M20/M25/M40 family metallo-hydrolase [Thermoleophilia bacterium]|nr:M20/M25/M40 family metallo-hydrolase [Thermoleophilia bacterium]
MGKARHLLAAVIVALVVLAVAVAVSPWDAPRPRPASAPADQFSSARAMDVLRRIAAEPHAIGSPQAAAVRRFIFGRLQELALMPHVQSAEVVSKSNPSVAGLVHNVVGRLPGRDPSRAVLLVAHYDSVPTAAGAADDGSGVAALLETARALRSGPPPKNDVIFLFTDGEEFGLLGSQAFLEQDPWAYAAGVVLDFDSPGSSSPALMYETSPRNGRLIAAYLAAGHAYGSSLMYEVARRQPVVSDFRPFVTRGIPGMTFGMLDGPAYDHTAYDSLASFHEAGLQHEGDTALALARRLGDADLWDLRAPDMVYFDLTGSVEVSYPVRFVLPVTVLGVALFAAAVIVAARRRLLTLRGVAWAALGTGGTLGASLLVVALVWTMYRTAYEQRVWTETGVVISDWYRLGLVLLSAAVVLAIYAALLRRLRAWDLAVVALTWWAAGSVLVGLEVPGASYLLTWSLVGGALGLGVAALLDRPSDGRPAAALVALAGAVPGLLFMSSAVYLLLMSAGLKQSVTVVAVWLIAGLLMLPLAVVLRAFRFWLPGALAVAGIVVLFAVGSTVAFDSEHPKFTSVAYRLDPAGKATWETLDRPDAYTRAFLGTNPQAEAAYQYYPLLGPRLITNAPAPSYGLQAPALQVLSDTTVGGRRAVRVRVRPRPGTAAVSLLVHTIVGNLTAGVDGHELAGRDTTLLNATDVRWSFDFFEPPAKGVVVEVDFAAGPPVLIRAVDFSYGLPAAASATYPARPAGMLPGRLGDVTLTEALARLPAAGR